MLDNNLYSSVQSAYRERHTTETAFFKVQNVILTALDSGSGDVFVMLDLSAVFDNIDHGILLFRLNSLYGISEMYLIGSNLIYQTCTTCYHW